MADRSLGRTVWNLVLALLNATLILVAVCLFLGWKVAETTNGMVAGVADRLAEFTPVRDELRALSGDIGALRDDLAAAQAGADDRRAAAYARMSGEIDAVSARLDAVLGQAEALVAAPEELIDQAVAAAGAEARQTVQAFGVCVAPETPPA